MATADFPLRQRTLDRCIAIGFRRGNVGIALDARYVRLAHVGDVLVLVAYFLDGERNHFQSHLVHVFGAGGSHAVGNHLRLLDDFFHRELADNAAQVAFHHQTDQAFALLIALGEELLGRGQNGLAIGLHLDLRHGFDRDCDALFGVEILLRRHVERHQFERQIAADLHHGQHQRAVSLHHPRPAQAVHDECLVRPRFAIEPGHSAHQKEDGHHCQPNKDPNLNDVEIPLNINASCYECS